MGIGVRPTPASFLAKTRLFTCARLRARPASPFGRGRNWKGWRNPVPKRSEGMEALWRWNPEKCEFAMQTRDEKMLCISRFFCEAKSHP